MSIWCAIILAVGLVISAFFVTIGLCYNGSLGVEYLCEKIAKNPEEFLDVYTDMINRVVEKMNDMY